MKLIIDIPEQMYLNAKADMLSGSDILVKAIKNGIPHETVTEFADRCRECGRERVLDKVRAEIDAIETHGQIDEHTLFARSADEVKNMVLEIIDKYRTVKGANE